MPKEFISTFYGEIVPEDKNTPAEWKKALDATPSIHKGDTSWTEKGAKLLDSLTKGKDYAVEKAKERNLKLQRPETYLISDPFMIEDDLAAGKTREGEYYLFVKSDSLKLAAQARNEKTHFNGSEFFQGSTFDYFFLGGIHEMRHIYDLQQEVLYSDEFGIQARTAQEYYANDYEYAATKEELAALRRAGIPDSKNTVYKRFQAARTFRKSQGK